MFCFFKKSKAKLYYWLLLTCAMKFIEVLNASLPGIAVTETIMFWGCLFILLFFVRQKSCKNWGRNFWKFGTNINLGSRTKWVHFCHHRLMAKSSMTSYHFNACKSFEGVLLFLNALKAHFNLKINCLFEWSLVFISTFKRKKYLLTFLTFGPNLDQKKMKKSC